MSKKVYLVTILFLIICAPVFSQVKVAGEKITTDSAMLLQFAQIKNQFSSTADFLDAAINSINSLNSLIKKENYHNKIISLNNPTNSNMGFNLENEIQTALKPLLAKAKNTNTAKFSQVVSSLLTLPTETASIVTKTISPAINPLFTSLISLIGALTIQEKRITRDDLDSFITTTSKYFIQYEKLNQANNLFDQNIESINNKLSELQFDLKEYMLDLITILSPNIQRSQLKAINNENLLLKYLDKNNLTDIIDKFELRWHAVQYPSDGIKTAKEISNTLQKLFTEYQKAYDENYQQIKNILSESKLLGKKINTQQVDSSLKELEDLYDDSKNFDVLSLRITTLLERLKTLAATEQNLVIQK